MPGAKVALAFETGGNYTKHIEPLAGFDLRGVIWYQGESNEKDKRDYLPKLTSLISGWRSAWNQGDFPVYFVQLPGIGTSTTENPAGGDGRAEIRQACVDALAIPNTGLAVTINVGALIEHPPNKLDTGIRLAHAALHHTYGLKEVPVSPLYKSHKIEGRAIRVSFENAPHGLMVAVKEGTLPPKPLPAFRKGLPRRRTRSGIRGSHRVGPPHGRRWRGAERDPEMGP